jgi:GT2 family glycosyltransferase
MTTTTRATLLKELWRDEGFVPTVQKLSAYARWRLRGRPLQLDSYETWMAKANLIDPPNPDPAVGFSVVMPVYNTEPEFLRLAVASVINQTHQRWELIMVDDFSTRAETVATAESLARSDTRVRLIRREENGGIAGATNTGIAEAEHEWVAFLDHDDVLHGSALAWFSTCAADVDMIYSDEDKIEVDGTRYSPTWKPAWSPRMLLGINYINHLTAVRTEIVRDLGGLREGFDGAQDHDFMLRLAEIPGLRVAHIPAVLYHWRIWPESFSQVAASSLKSENSGLKAVGEATERRGWSADVGLSTGTPYNYRPRFRELDDRPTVKVVIPTRDRLKLLRRCITSLFERTDGVDLHVVVIDNGSTDAATLDYLAGLADREDFTVQRIDDEFNYSHLCNVGADLGPPTDLLLFLNNDTEVLGRSWLKQLVGWLTWDEDVCCVGAKLFYKDRTIQHAGVVLGLGGVAGHYVDKEPNEPRLNNHHDQVREVSAVTAALMLVRSADFARIGGFNEDMPLVYQDIDFCLRLADETGGSVLYDPTYPAMHRGSASRPKYDPEQTYGVLRFQMLWADRIATGDAFYSPHLTLADSDLSLREVQVSTDEFAGRFTPRISRNPE